jgi:hypothetical protein
MGEVCLDRRGEKGEDVAALLTTRFDHREHRLHEAAARRALRAEGKLPPNHCLPQGALAGA